jgi:RNA polymerase sigma factor (sigma-70 family)
MSMQQLDLEALGKVTREARKAFEENIISERPALWRYCLKLTGSPWDAEDLVQETILKAFGFVPFYYQEVIPRAYLFRMATNTWIDQCRKSGFRLDSIDDKLEMIADEDVADPMELRSSIEHLIRILPPRQRVVLLLRDVFEFTAREVAEMISVTEGAVKAILHRARTTLRHRSNEDMNPPQVAAPNQLHQAMVDAYIDAFIKRDADAIAALLYEDAIVDIVGVTHECGRDTIRKYSLEHTAQDTSWIHAKVAVLWGEPVVLVFSRPEQEPQGLRSVIRLESSEEYIFMIKEYYFCPEILRLAAEELHIPVYPNGYFWTSSD